MKLRVLAGEEGNLERRNVCVNEVPRERKGFNKQGGGIWFGKEVWILLLLSLS